LVGLQPEDRVVYIDGAFDLFHAGHIEALRQAKALGSFVVVGIYEEDVVRRLNRASHSIPVQTVRFVVPVALCRADGTRNGSCTSEC
jgi:cytidyltransferase-like protein